MLSFPAAAVATAIGVYSPEPAQPIAVPPKLLNSEPVIRGGDYPRQALKQGATGRVVIGLDIDDKGQITGCRIDRTSGSPALDLQSCALYADRAHYAPGRDAAGKAAASTAQRSIDWVIERGATRVVDAASPTFLNSVGIIGWEDYPKDAIAGEQEGSVAVSLQVDREGRVSSCSVTSSSNFTALDEATCRLLTERARFKPAESPGGDPVAGEYAQRITWRLENRRMPWGDWTDRMVMSFSEPGKVSGCRREVVVEGPATDADCTAAAAEMMQVQAVPGLPDMAANLIFETRFTPRELSGVELEIPVGTQVFSRRVVRVELALGAQRPGCTLVQAIGMGPPVGAVCEEVRRTMRLPELEPGARPSIGTLIISVSARVVSNS